MAIITMTTEEIMQPLTPEQIGMLEALRDRVPEPDDECPEITPEQFKYFRRRSDRLRDEKEHDDRDEVVIRLSPENMDKARTLGRMRLSKLLEHALNDEELMKRIS